MPTIEVPKEKWSGKVREITLGATAADGGTRAKTVTVGGETTLPYLHFEGDIPHPPAIAIEVQDRKPADWSSVLLEAWGDVTEDPAAWAKAAEEAGADVVMLKFSLHDDLNAEYARETLRVVLDATGLPLIVFGPGQAELDNELLVAVAEEGKGENQLNILISDMNLPLERVVMDPTTGALGYGMEYGYSVMERLRLAALQGDGMTQQPMLVTPGEEAWRAKEARTEEGVPEAWGDWAERAVNWETLTASALVESGADILVLRHPESVNRVRAMIDALMSN
jgi:acetyl-CoA decarbonylase/synthase complex subunit delta